MQMQMIEPDYWRGRGRYSKKALSRKIVDSTPIIPVEGCADKADKH